MDTIEKNSIMMWNSLNEISTKLKDRNDKNNSQQLQKSIKELEASKKSLSENFKHK